MNIVNSLTLYEVAIHGSKHTYFIAYFAFAIVDLVLQFAVTWELAVDVFCPTGSWAPRRTQGICDFGARLVGGRLLTCMPAGTTREDGRWHTP